MRESFNLNSLRATLHFIDPNVEKSVSSTLLELETCARAIDEAMRRIALLDGTLDGDVLRFKWFRLGTRSARPAQVCLPALAATGPVSENAWRGL